MNKEELTKLLLKNYSYTKSRIIFLQQQKEMIYNRINQKSNTKQPSILKKKVSYAEKFYKDNLDEITFSLVKKFNHCDDELNQLLYIKRTVDNSMQSINSINPKYKLILEKHYFYKVRIEDIAELIHLGRTSSYDLKRTALNTLSKLLFGEN